MSVRSDAIAPFLVMEVLERAQELEKAGRHVVHLEVGEPDFDTPEVVREAGIRAIRDGHTHYTHSLGRPELREAVAEWHSARFGAPVRADEVIITLGSSSAMSLLFAALLDPGDEVLVPDPGYPCYPKFARILDARPVPVPLREETGFEYRIADLERACSSRSRLLVLNSPSNPTGTVFSPETIGSLVQWCQGRVTILSDEIYAGLVYDRPPVSLRQWDGSGIVVSGFSKLFAMTGWRLGYAIVPPPLLRTLQRLQQNLFISPPDFAQIAATVALREAGPAVEAMCEEYDRRRRYLLGRLEAMGLPAAGKPAGAFYLFLNVSEYTHDVYRFSFDLLEQAGVAVAPGVDFGEHGEGYIRICYAASLQQLEEGMDRIARFLESRPRIQSGPAARA